MEHTAELCGNLAPGTFYNIFPLLAPTKHTGPLKNTVDTASVWYDVIF